MENISHIIPYERTATFNQSLSPRQKPKTRYRKTRLKAKRHFKTLSTLVGDTHRDLLEQNSPFRLCVHKTEEDVFMDVITMNKSQKVDNSFTRLITNDDMRILVKRIHNRMGLILDYSV